MFIEIDRCQPRFLAFGLGAPLISELSPLSILGSELKHRGLSPWLSCPTRLPWKALAIGAQPVTDAGVTNSAVSVGTRRAAGDAKKRMLIVPRAMRSNLAVPSNCHTVLGNLHTHH